MDAASDTHQALFYVVYLYLTVWSHNDLILQMRSMRFKRVDDTSKEAQSQDVLNTEVGTLLEWKLSENRTCSGVVICDDAPSFMAPWWHCLWKL